MLNLHPALEVAFACGDLYLEEHLLAVACPPRSKPSSILACLASSDATTVGFGKATPDAVEDPYGQA